MLRTIAAVTILGLSVTHAVLLPAATYSYTATTPRAEAVVIAFQPIAPRTAHAATTPTAPPNSAVDDPGPHIVPFYSQFADISRPEWRKISCGIASIAMLIDFYTDAVPADTLLAAGIARGAYIQNAGWSHQGLIDLAADYDLTGATVGLADRSMADAFAALEQAVAEGPVIASVHYTFTPTNPIPHLVVITGVSDGVVHYNDPAEETGGGTVSIEQFQSSWKKRYIEIRPVS